MAEVEIRDDGRGGLEVSLSGRVVAYGLVDVGEVSEWLDGLVPLPCDAEVIQGGRRDLVTIPARR